MIERTLACMGDMLSAALSGRGTLQHTTCMAGRRMLRRPVVIRPVLFPRCGHSVFGMDAGSTQPQQQQQQQQQHMDA
eukprot:4139626-Alexandrium_andersonii.AAC.1